MTHAALHAACCSPSWRSSMDGPPSPVRSPTRRRGPRLRCPRRLAHAGLMHMIPSPAAVAMASDALSRSRARSRDSSKRHLPHVHRLAAIARDMVPRRCAWPYGAGPRWVVRRRYQARSRLGRAAAMSRFVAHVAARMCQPRCGVAITGGLQMFGDQRRVLLDRVWLVGFDQGGSADASAARSDLSCSFVDYGADQRMPKRILGASESTAFVDQLGVDQLVHAGSMPRRASPIVAEPRPDDRCRGKGIALAAGLSRSMRASDRRLQRCRTPTAAPSVRMRSRHAVHLHAAFASSRATLLGENGYRRSVRRSIAHLAERYGSEPNSSATRIEVSDLLRIPEQSSARRRLDAGLRGTRGDR